MGMAPSEWLTIGGVREDGEVRTPGEERIGGGGSRSGGF